MRHRIRLDKNWHIAQYYGYEEIREIPDCEWLATEIPAQVHDILLKHKRIADPRLPDMAEKCKWVGESDWVYQLLFPANLLPGTFLCFEGIDTIADIYLNSVHIHSHESMFLPAELDVSGILQEENELTLLFRSPWKELNAREMPEEWKSVIPKYRLLRKMEHDFGDYLGPKPYLTKIGIFGHVWLDYRGESYIEHIDISTSLTENLKEAKVRFTIEGHGAADAINYRVLSPDGSVAAIEEIGAVSSGVGWEIHCVAVLDKPELWWPLGYGDQSLYHLEVKLYSGENQLDERVLPFGVRQIDMEHPFDFKINGRQVKLWGTNLAPPDCISHCYDRGRAHRLLMLAKHSHMNIIRVWGAGEPLDDDFYSLADAEGILIWQDFFHEYGMVPYDEIFRELCMREGRYLIRRLKHHSSLLMWCGGNENYMARDFVHPSRDFIGRELFRDDYRELVGKLDPSRWYLENSPHGGLYANDPLVMDTHSYTNTWFVPGCNTPVFVSENLRVSLPPERSLRRYLTDDEIWPEGYDGRVRHPGRLPWPRKWERITSAVSWRKIPEIERFYDPVNVGELVYNFGMAHGDYLRRTVELYRRGKVNSLARRSCFGHMVWKLHASWPHLYSNVVDYYLEPYIPYYALRRAYEPLLLCFDVSEDSPYLWMVNDTPDDWSGEVRVALFDTSANKFTQDVTVCGSVAAGDSNVLFDFSRFGQFDRGNNVLYAATKSGVYARGIALADIERHIAFPPAKIDIACENGKLIITTDAFAHCIELSVPDCPNGWLFEDNYFDLLPGECKVVGVVYGGKKCRIHAKAAYSLQIAEVMYIP